MDRQTDLYDDKPLPLIWAIPAGIALAVLFGFTFYTIGSMLRGAML